MYLFGMRRERAILNLFHLPRMLRMKLTIPQTAWGAASDFALAALPAYIIWPLRITKRMRAVLYFLLSLGLIAGAMAITRTWAVVLLAKPDYSCKCSCCSKTPSLVVDVTCIDEGVTYTL